MIFDPRTFLQNKDVVELSKRNMGKRNLVFYFENQEAFAAVPEAWILTWNEGVEREFDKGKAVRTASGSRRQQFFKALDTAKMTMLADAPSSSGGAKKDIEISDQESSASEEEPESLQDVEPSAEETTPANPLKEVSNEAVLCSSCGKPIDLSKGPVLLDGWWFCHQCHKGPSSSQVKPISSTTATNIARPSTGSLNADATWLAVRDEAINQVNLVGGGGSGEPQIEIDDEIMKGITMRVSAFCCYSICLVVVCQHLLILLACMCVCPVVSRCHSHQANGKLRFITLESQDILVFLNHGKKQH
jgi:hypothetical protein